MDQRLREAAQQGSIDALHSLVQEDPNVLDKIDEIPFVETPLHIAASAGHTQFAMEIMRLKPSLARKLNQDRFSPMHIALQNNQTQVVSRLLDVDKDLVRVQGKEGVTPLHYVAQTGNLDLLAEFQKVCPMSIKDVTIRRETALHIALNNNKLIAFERLRRWLQLTTLEDASSLLENKLLNWKNEEGNTLLHIAVSNNQPLVVRRLLNARVDTNATNLKGLTALGILQARQRQNGDNEIRDMLTSSLPRNMENATDLSDATEQENMDALYELIQTDAKVLDRMDDISFVETPLHIAASVGHTLFAWEIMRLKPSFVRKLDQNGFTPMHLALQSNQTKMVLQLLDADKDLVRVKGKEGVTPLHYVAQIGNLVLLKKFLEVCPESIKDVTIRKETVLHIALKYNMFDAFQLLLHWLQNNWLAIASVYQKKLLGWQDYKGNTVLHMAVSMNQTEVVRWLLDARIYTNTTNLADSTALILQGQTENEIRDMLTSSLPRNTENATDLRDATEQGNIDALYKLIQTDAEVLDKMDDISFVESPLHIAASAGHTLFAREIMRLKPSFVRKLDRNGFTPMHLALQSNQKKMVLQLLDADKDLVRVEGKEGMTPLHYVAQIGNLDLLAKLLEVYPESIEDITIRKETVLHIALKYNMYEAFQFLLSWLRHKWFTIASVYQKKLLGWQDDEGNTVLHIAVFKNQTEIVRSLLSRRRFRNAVGKNTKNSEDKTALDILNQLNRQTGIDNSEIRNMLRSRSCWSFS